MLGNDKGEFMVYDVTGDRILRQKLHISAILEIKSRPASMGTDREAVEDVSIVFHDVLCCIPLPELLAFIRLHEAGSGQNHDPSLKLAHGKFGFGKSHANRTDGIHLGVRTPSLKSQLKKADGDSDETKIGFLSVGRSPAVGMFEATTHGSQSGAFALIGKFASSMTLGFSSMAWKNGRKVLRGGVRSWLAGSKDEELLPTESTILQFSLRDNKRHVQNLIPAPMNSLAVVSDNLGRVLLFDTQRSMVLRIWKGYRDAQCAWVTHPADGTLHLVIYGWRRETLEVWPMRYGARIYSMVIGPRCKILPTTPPMALHDNDWHLRCGVLDYENEEIWNVADKVFPKKSAKVEAIWDMMLTEDTH